MQPLMTYSQNNNLQQYQSMYQPYTDRYMPVQQYQQIMSPTQMTGASQFTPLGKIVESMDIVKVTDIPMDGNMYYFLKADGSEIYSKQFMSNGQTRILTFKPYFEDNADNSLSNDKNIKIGISDEVTEVFSNILNQINGRLDQLDFINARKNLTNKEDVKDE